MIKIASKSHKTLRNETAFLVKCRTDRAVQKLLDREIERQYSKLDEGVRTIIDSRKIVSLLKTNSYCLSNACQIKKFVREAFSVAITDEVL